MKLQAVRVERTVQGDREIKLPFKCFGCHDGGLIGGQFIAHFVEGQSDIPFICNRDECDAGRVRRSAWSANNDPNYRNAFDTRLDKYACEDIHKWEKQSYLDDLAKQRSPQAVEAPTAIAVEYFQKVDNRDRQIAEIQQAIASSQNPSLTAKIQKTVQMCSDRDEIIYQAWEFLPSEDLQRILNGIKQLQGVT